MPADVTRFSSFTAPARLQPGPRVSPLPVGVLALAGWHDAVLRPHGAGPLCWRRAHPVSWKPRFFFSFRARVRRVSCASAPSNSFAECSASFAPTGFL